MGIDIEAAGLDPHSSKFLLLQINDGTNIYVFNVQKLGNVIFEHLRPILENEKIYKIGHNIQIEYLFLRTKGIMMDGLKDLFLQETVLYNGKAELKTKGRRSLQGLIYAYLGIKIDKEVRESFIDYKGTEFTDRQIEYAASDVKYLHLVNEKQEYILKNQGLWNAARLENACVPAVSEIAYNGLYLDKQKWMALNTVNREKLASSVIELDQHLINTNRFQPDLFGMTGIDFNSNIVLERAIQQAGYPIPDTLNNSLLLYLPKDFYEKIRKFRVNSKAVSTYGEAYLRFINRKTGRIHPRVNQFWAESSRITTSAPNLQAIPIRDNPEYRTCFTPQEIGWLLNSADYAGQELRITAELCQEPLWVECLNKDLNLHAEIGTRLFKTTITKKHDKYIVIKGLNFAIIYGAGASKVVSLYKGAGSNIDIDEAESVLRDYYSLNPRLVSYIDSYIIQCIQQGYSESILGTRRYFDFPPTKWEFNNNDGRYRFFPKSRDKEDWKLIGALCREAFNNRIQSTGGNMTKLAMVFYFRKIKKGRLHTKLVNSIHDELLDEVKREYCDEYAIIKRDCMEKAQSFILKTIKPSVEFNISEYWAK